MGNVMGQFKGSERPCQGPARRPCGTQAQVSQLHEAGFQGYGRDMDPGGPRGGGSARMQGKRSQGVPEGQKQLGGCAGCHRWELRVKEISGHVG